MGRGDAFLCFVVAAATSFVCVRSADHLSATFDEPFHFQSGLTAWRTGSNHALMRAGAMPIPMDVQSLPIYLWERHRGEPIDVEANWERVITIARAANLVFWWLLLFFGFSLAKKLGEPWAGRVALLLIATEPTILGHAALAATDTSVTAAMVGFVWYYLSFRESHWKYRVVGTGIVYGIALLCKASALVFGPLIVLVVEAWFHGREAWQTFRNQPGVWGRIRAARRITSPLRWQLFAGILVGLVVVFGYCGSDYAPQSSFVKWAKTLPDGTLREVMEPLANDLRIFPNAGEALVYQIKHNIRGHGTFLLGEEYRRAVKWYFPVVLSMKLTIPVLALIVAGLLFRRRDWWSPLGIVVLTLFLFSLNTRVQNGVRIMMPLMALTMALLGVVWGKWLATRSCATAWGLYALLTVAVASPVAQVWPNMISYVNPLWGGTAGGYQLVSDSNYDWGQGLVELEQWYGEREPAESANKPVLFLWYFGTDPRGKEKPFYLLHPHMLHRDDPREIRTMIGDNYLAVGATILYGDHRLFSPWSRDVVDYLRTLTPVARTQTFFIYRFPHEGDT